jgi:hypothetical protein
MVLVVLGLIAVGAAMLLIYYSITPGKRSPDSETGDRRSSAREKQYEKSDDGKVVYLYNRNEDETGGDAKVEDDNGTEGAQTDSGGENDDGDDAGKGSDAD